MDEVLWFLGEYWKNLGSPSRGSSITPARMTARSSKKKSSNYARPKRNACNRSPKKFTKRSSS
jgi:hypothetical protein